MGSLSKVLCSNNTCAAHSQNISCNTRHLRIELKNSYSKVVILSSNIIFCKNAINTIWLAHLPGLPCFSVGTILAQGKAVDIARPVFNSGRSLHALFVALSRKINEDEREIENNFASNTANRVRIDKTDGDKILQAMTNIAFTYVHE